MNITKEQLLVEVEDCLRTMPPQKTIRHGTPENLIWFGRVSAVIQQWNPEMSKLLRGYLDQFQRINAREAFEGFHNILILLHQARHDLQMRTLGPTNIAIPQGLVFNYFDEIRKIIEIAKEELFFIDPYLDAEFVSRYFPNITTGVSIRLLAREKLSTLLPAVDAFIKQEVNVDVAVRSASNFHDRYIFVDNTACYQSGASFKDGAKSAPTTLTQITDAFAAVLKIYEDLWNRGKIER
jgi:hypothetical protein